MDEKTLRTVAKMLTNLSHTVYRRHECPCQGDGVVLALSTVEALLLGMAPLEAILMYDQALSDTLPAGEREVCAGA